MQRIPRFGITVALSRSNRLARFSLSKPHRSPVRGSFPPSAIDILRFMFAFLVRRLVLTLPIIWIVVTLVFGLIHMVPGDPVAQMLGEGASVTEVERLRHELGLD